MSQLNWYVARNGQQVGPFPLESLAAQASAGQLGAIDLVWCEGMTDWIEARRVPEVAKVLGLMPVAPVGYDVQSGPNDPQQPPYAVPYAAPAYGAGGALNYHSPAMPDVHFAGFWIRFVALFIDGLILAVPSLLMNLAFTGQLIADGNTMRSLESTLAQMVIEWTIGWLYHALFTSSSYQATPGKLAVGIRVTDVYGNTISFGRATGRHFAKILSGIIIGIGYIMAAFDEKKRALHDQMCGTLVSYKNR